MWRPLRKLFPCGYGSLPPAARAPPGQGARVQGAARAGSQAVSCRSSQPQAAQSGCSSAAQSTATLALAHWGPAGMRTGRRLNQLRAGFCLLLASLQLVSWTLAGEAGRRAGIVFGGTRETPRCVRKGEIVRNGCYGDGDPRV